MLSGYRSSMVQHLKFQLYWEEISWDEHTPYLKIQGKKQIFGMHLQVKSVF